MDGALSDALVRSRRFFTRGEVSDDLRTLSKVGGRAADDFYRDRWSHDKVVRSTHGVNCTGSCSWKVYVKDGIITWETQQTDYPSVGPDSPEYEPRGCPRGAAFSWYTYSPTRVRYPYVRGVLLQMFREAKSQHDGDPVRAWEHIVENPLRAKAYKAARGKGGLVRATWEEAVEIVAAAHVHTIRKYGPDRVAGFSPIPAMSMVSHASGARFVNLIGGSMLSFYDWYADLPVASPQVFGDQTDVPESGDWWNAGYLMMWGSNLPVTRTPDAHWMAEARYRGQKVIAVAPDYADNVKFADEWLPARPGTDAALAMAMGHVVLKEFFVDRQAAYFEDYVKSYTDLPHLVRLEEAGDGEYTAGKFLTAADLPAHQHEENAAFKTVLIDARTDEPVVPHGIARPPLRRDRCRPVEPRARRRRPEALVDRHLGRQRARPAAPLRHPRRGRGRPAARGPGPPGRRPPGDHGLRPAARPVRRGPRRAAGRVAPGDNGYDDASAPYTPAWQEQITGVPASRGRADRAGVRPERRGLPRALDDRDGCGHQPLVPLRHDLPLVPDPHHAHRLPGRQRRRLGALRGPGEGPADHRLHPDRQRAGLEPAAAEHDPDRLLVPPHRPVPLRPVRRGHAVRDHGQGPARRPVHRRRDRAERADGLDAVLPDLQPQPARALRRGGRGRSAGRASTSSTS